MRVGLFLDFDGVLTPKPVNMQIASLLGGQLEKELLALEKKFDSGSLSSQDFGASLVPLFREGGFTKYFLDENFKSIQLDPFAIDLVHEFIDTTFIVTSSPNYFMDRFCMKYGIPPSRYICSEYGFDTSGKIDSSVRPCTVQDKEQFVRRMREGFDLTIGVGNRVEQDGPFLSLCDLRVLMGEERRDYLSAMELYSVLTLVRAIRKRSDSLADSNLVPPECRDSVRKLFEKSNYERNVFIMTPYRVDARYQVCIDTIKKVLKQAGFFGYLATDYELTSGGDLWQNVRAFMHGCKFGVAIVTADEEQRHNKVIVKSDIFNPNVIAEIGYMMGNYKSVLLLKDNRVRVLPTDWLGKLFVGFDLNNPETQVATAIKKWLQEIGAN
jgi:phosphoserine phosphatase